MRKTVLVICIIMCYEMVSGQVHNTGSTLRPGNFSLGIAPIFFVDRGNDVGFLIHGGAGLTRGMDLAFKCRLNNHETYFGGDLEFALLKGIPSLSLATGMHYYKKLGIDATLNLSFSVRKIASIYGGADLDIEFGNRDVYFPFWGFLGFEVMVRKHLGILMEIDIAVSDEAENMFGLGLCVYF